MRKITGLILVLLLGTALVACKKAKFTVTFDSNGGGEAPASQLVEKNSFAEEPTTPTAPSNDVRFAGWFVELETGSAFNFKETPITGNITLYAKWLEKGKSLLSFDTKVSGLTIATQSLLTGEQVPTKPTDPTRVGYRFGGWYNTKAGLIWSSPNEFSFDSPISEDKVLYAYWEPVSSRDITYSSGETYKASLSASISNMNPLVYKDALESDMFDMLTANLYTTEVDWAKAIKQGVADYEGDFSKIKSGDYSVEALDYKYVTLNATEFPADADGEMYLDENGDYDRDAAALSSSTVWRFKIRQDLKFEDGTPINASTYEFALKQYLDPNQLNYRASLYMESDGSTSGTPILNAKAYYEQATQGKPAVDWSEVGFKVIDNYTFEITTSKPISQADAVGFGGLKLVHPEKYTSGLNAAKTATNYGTIDNPLVSYGSYVLKTWDSGSKFVFYKNFDYPHKHKVTIKAYEYQVIASEDDRMRYFTEGKLNVVALGATYYPQYAESEDVYKTPTANLQNLTINLHQRGDGKATPEILKDVDFRWALYYGFNRKGYNDTAYAPNSPSTNFLSLITRQFRIGDQYNYNQSSAYLELAQKYDLATDTYGYVPSKAKELFDGAYAKLPSGTKVVLDMPYPNYEHIKRAAEYIKDMYEGLFGKDKFELNLTPLADDPMDLALKQRNFDLNLNHVGYGVSYAAFFQLPGLFINTDGNEMGLPEGFNLSEKTLEVNLVNLYNYLKELEDDELSAMDKQMLELFDENGVLHHENVGQFVKELVGDYPRWWTTSSSYDGAVEDLSRLSAAFEDIILSELPVIPISSRGSATLYKDVHIEWPAWSSLFNWGSGQYRYLTTDPDFQ